MRFVRSPLIASALLLCACASETVAEPDLTLASTENRQCFWPSQVSGYNHAGKDQIYVHTGPSDVYLFQTFGPCPELDFSEKVAFEATGPGTICSGLDVTLIVPTAIGPQRCPVRMIRKMTEVEARAL